MPFALILLSGDSNAPVWVGQAAAALAFLLVGAGLHTVQTVGPRLGHRPGADGTQPKVVALLCMMLLLGMVASALLFGVAAAPVQRSAPDPGDPGCRRRHDGAELHRAVEAGGPRPLPHPRHREQPSATPGASSAAPARPDAAWPHSASAPSRSACRTSCSSPTAATCSASRSAQTTAMTALLAIGGLIGFAIGARTARAGCRSLSPGRHRRAGRARRIHALIFAAPFDAPLLFAIGVFGVGLGGGLFAHCTLTAAISSCGTQPGRPRARHLGRRAGVGRRVARWRPAD